MNRQERRASAKQSKTAAPQRLPQNFEAVKQGKSLFDLGRYAEALECFNIFEKHNPNIAALYQTRGLCFQRLGRFEEAQADFERSIALNPGEAETHKNLGTLHSRSGRMEQAFASFDRALALRPNFSAALSEKARALWGLQLLDEAFAAFHKSLAVDPGNALTTWNLALLQMLTGDFERGLSGREARWKASSLGLVDRGFSQPLWLRDQPLEGKTILLHADEGLGDSIQFARYVPFVAALGAQVILEVKPAVQSLLAAVTGVAHCIDRSSTPSLAFDLHCPLGSLPLAFGTRLDTIPFAEGFLPAPLAARVKAWKDRLGPRTRFRVGLAWSGDPDHKNDHNRSISLRALAPLLDCDIEFVSLQKGIRDQDRAFLRERPDIVDLTEQLTDFSETAALVSCLDLVISVDTSVVHLTGALGVPVWTMVPFNPDWRWLLNRDDSPWYSSMRLFRQPQRGDWASVVDRVCLELERLVSAWRPEPRQHQSALTLKPQDALLSNYLGYQLWQLGRMEEAVQHFQRALKLYPQYLDAANNCGRLLLDLGRHAEALECLDVAEKLNPNSAALYRIRGICLQEANRFKEAEADYAKSLALDSSPAETHNNFGLLHWRLGRTEQAFASIDRALELRPDFAAALSNKAWMLLDLQLLDDAFATFRRSLAIDPNSAPTIHNFALLQLLTGDFERGWLGREARWKASSLGLVDRGFSQPLWLGDQPIEGKTILLYCDEGLGDSIQFARYVPMVAALGAHVILGVQPAIQQLLAGMPGVAMCIGRPSATTLAFDLHCPLGSLPLALGTRLDTIPFAEPYLPAPPAARVKAWEDRLGLRTRFRVGLAWSGNPDHKNDHNRSMALRTLAPLLDCDVQFVSLQKGVRDQDRVFLGERPDIVDLTDQLTDFSDTAALISCLDLVISVDTSVVHLAGALGAPVWTMVPFNPDWRWLLHRDDSPWYSSMRLFRQPKRGDWAGVVDCVRLELERLVSARPPRQEPSLLLPAE